MDLTLAAEKLALWPEGLTQEEVAALFQSPITAASLARLAPDALAALLTQQAGLDGLAEGMFKKIVALDCEYHKPRLQHPNIRRGPFAEFLQHRLGTARKSGLLFDHILREVMPTSRKAFLEIGAGLGFGMLHALHRGFEQAHGIEIDELYAQTAVEEFKGSDELHYTVGDYLKWDSDIKFDLIFCVDVLEHIQSIPACLRHLERHLSVNGLAIVRFTVATIAGVVLNEPHYKKPWLSLCEDAGAQRALELKIIREKSKYVVNRWPVAEDISKWTDEYHLHAYVNIENIDTMGAPMFYTMSMWRDRLKKLNDLTSTHPIYEQLAREPQSAAWRSRVESALTELESGGAIPFRDAMELLGSYWTLVISRKPIQAKNLVPYSWLLNGQRLRIDPMGTWEAV